jgi:D-serine dehydratase
MSAVDQADRLLMDKKAPVITDAMLAEQSRQLNADFDKLAATALRIKAERDALHEALDRLVALVDVVAEDFSDSPGIIRADHAAVLNARAALAKVSA